MIDPESIDPAFLGTRRGRPRIRRRRFDTVRQNDETDCGPACLATISSMYGNKIGLPRFRLLADVTRSGTSMLHLARAAEEVGYRTVGIRTDAEDLGRLRVPAITLLDHHFVVVLETDRKGVALIDPRFGRRRLSWEKFREAWSGALLLLYPTERFFAQPAERRDHLRYLRALSGFEWTMTLILILGGVSFVAGLGLPFLNQVIFDTALPQRDRHLLHVLVGAMVLLAALDSATDLVVSYLKDHFAARLEVRFSAVFVAILTRLPLKYFAARRAGDFLTRLEDISRLRTYFTQLVLDNAINGLEIGFYSILIGLYSGRVLIAFLALFPVYFLLLYALSPRARRLRFELEQLRSRIRSLTLEQLRGFQSLKAIHGTVLARWRWQALQLEAAGIRGELDLQNSLLSGLTRFLFEAIRLAVVAAALSEFIRGRLTPGQVICLTFLTIRLLDPLVDLVEELRDFGDVSVTLNRMDDVFDAEAEPGVATEAALEAKSGLPALNGEIRFADVSFRYGGELSRPVLTDLSFEIRPGELLAIAGESGSGKSTLAFLINLLHRPSRGRITINGIDVTGLPLDHLRSQVSLVPQESQILSGSIFENIAVGDPGASLEAVTEAARLAQADSFITRLPAGYATWVGEEGHALSGGEAQRIGIARAFFRRTPIMIFDEPTSALDPSLEAKILDAIANRAPGTTVLYISHRIHTLHRADRILCLRGGKRIELGSHAELMEGRGLYHALYTRSRQSAEGIG